MWNNFCFDFRWKKSGYNNYCIILIHKIYKYIKLSFPRCEAVPIISDHFVAGKGSLRDYLSPDPANLDQYITLSSLVFSL